MKKLTFLLVITILIAAIPFVVFAESGYDVTTKVNGELIKDESIYKLNITLNNIKDKSGIALIEYDIKFDPAVFQLTKSDVKVPDIWKEHIETEMAENLSRQVGDGEYNWLWIMAFEGYGIKEDGQFALDLEFKVLKEAETEISVSAVDLINDNMEPISANSVAVKINTSSAGSEEIDSDVPPIPPEYSVPLIPSEPATESSETDNSDSIIELNPIVSSAESVSSADNSENDSSSGNKDNGNVTLIVILSIIGAAAVAVCVFVLVKRKGSNK